MNILEFYKSITLVYYYSEAPFLFTNINQMTIVESDFGHFWSVNLPIASQLETVYDNKDILCTSSVNTDLMFSTHAGEDALVAFVDESFALQAAFNFFNNFDSLLKEILSKEIYLTMEFEKIFNGSISIRNMPMFDVASSTTGYTLDKFFSEEPELHPTFYLPDFYCGPDLIFFVQFENQIVVPDGKITNEKLNKPIIKKVIELCEKNKKPRFLPQQTIYKQHNQTTEKQQLIGIIDRENVSHVFQKDHLTFLNVLKYTMKKYGKDESEEVEMKGNSKGGINC
ncbi:hypothetical protein C1645_838040 [Glomus cerebriforme]|uniref:Uncharacterized protein n=1 Tax=Glomus cerebriforme TaxID=658196 RepID=A0A397S486_9GLOM|nr:hypothetical protein C1645_838040 [Glomus cerebriforme]